MKLLIDGNNLLHASDVFPDGRDRSLGAAQRALVAALTAKWTASELNTAVIVFDGNGGAKHGSQVTEIAAESSDRPRVLFPNRKQDADDVLESFLRAEREPTRLLVVSSDHRIQRAARQAGAKYIDSEAYWREIRRPPVEATEVPDDRQQTPDEGEVQAWLKKFQGLDWDES